MRGPLCPDEDLLADVSRGMCAWFFYCDGSACLGQRFSGCLCGKIIFKFVLLIVG